MFNLLAGKQDGKIIISTTKPEIPRKNIVHSKLLDNTNFNEEQKEVIYEAIDKHLPYQLIMDIDYSAEKMRIILKCMEENIEIHRYVNPSNFDAEQLNVIYEVIKKGLDILPFTNEYIPASEMRKMKIGLELNVDLSGYMEYPEDILYEIGISLKRNVIIDDYIDGVYNAKQLEQIRLGLLSGVDVSIYTSPEYSSGHMELIRKLMEADKDVEALTDPSIDFQVALRLFKIIKRRMM